MGLLSWLIPGLDAAGKIAEHTANAAIDWEYQKKQNAFNADEAEKARDFNAAEAEKNRDFQTSEREAAQQWDLEMWNKNNEYNSPVEQMNRMLEAGINPNTAVGQIQGGNASAPTTSAQSGSAASGPAASGSFSGGAPGTTNFGTGLLQAKQMHLGLEKMQEDIESTRLVNAWQEIQNKYAEDNAEIDYKTKQVLYDKANQEVRKLEKECKKFDIEYDLDMQEYVKRLVRNPQEIRDADVAFNLVMAQIRAQEEQIKNLKKTGNLIEAQTATEGVKQAVGQSEIALNQANKELIEANKDQVDETIKIFKTENEAKTWWFEQFGYIPQDDTVKFFMKCLSLEDRSKANVMWLTYLKATQSYMDAETYVSNPVQLIDHTTSGFMDNLFGLDMEQKYPGTGNSFNFRFNTHKPSKFNPRFGTGESNGRKLR